MEYADHNEARAALAAIIEREGVTVDSVFVPWSASRNKAEKHRTLNWRVTLKRNGRDVITTDYSAGVAHCPAYKAPIKALGHANSLLRSRFIEWETENGKESHWNEFQSPRGHKPILPDAINVVSSLAMDSDVIDAGGFEDWASNYGYDTDSRSAEATYRACLEIALKLRSALGNDVLEEMRNAAQQM